MYFTTTTRLKIHSTTTTHPKMHSTTTTRPKTVWHSNQKETSGFFYLKITTLRVIWGTFLELRALPNTHSIIHRQWYKVFCTKGCVLFENGSKVRCTGEECKNLLRAARAERFVRCLKECCNIHHGRDTTYLHQVFFPKHHGPTKRRRKSKAKKKVSV